MKYRDRTTAEIYTLPELQQKFSTVSFPTNWDSTTFDFTNTDPVVFVPEPLPSTPCMKVVYNGVQYVDGQWTEAWSEQPLHADTQQQTVCEEELFAVHLDRIRNQRNILLAETDYTQLPDAPITEESKLEFQTYRQALRNVTSQPDLYNIVWPERPVYVAS